MAGRALVKWKANGWIGMTSCGKTANEVVYMTDIMGCEWSGAIWNLLVPSCGVLRLLNCFSMIALNMSSLK